MQPSNDSSPRPIPQPSSVPSVLSALTGEAAGPGKLSLVAQESPLLRHVEPWTNPVIGEQLLDDIFRTIKRYVIAEDATLHAVTLWAIHTWLMDVWTVSPIANITAPEMRCGKTLLLQALEELVCRPMTTSNITPAALFRAVDEWCPTLLIDEVDSFIKTNDAARGMLNVGLYKKGAFITRCARNSDTPILFSVWCAKALCGIGALAGTLADRSIVLRLRRKLPSESTENLRRSSPAQWRALRSRILRWTDDHREALFSLVPAVITEINDRANDCWEPLLAIAEVAGSRWTQYARSAAKALKEGEDHIPSVGIELLESVREAFWPSDCSKLFSSTLLHRLINSNKRWARFDQGRPLSAHQLARMLRQFGIHAKPIRIGGSAGKNGYERSLCEDAFARYLDHNLEECLTVQRAA